MKTTPALAAPPTRAPSLSADGGSDGNFAATLDLARAPVKGAADRPAKPAAGTPPPSPKAATKASPGATSESGRSPKARAEDASAADEPAEAQDLPDAAQMPPGWPGAAVATDAAASALAAGATAAHAGPGDDAELDGLLAQAAMSTDTSAATPGKSRPLRPTLGALPAQPALISAAGLQREAAPAAAHASPVAAAATAIAATRGPAQLGADALTTNTPAAVFAAAPLPPAHAAALGAAPQAAAPFAVQLAAAIDTPGFAPALATQVSWLVQEGVQLARLTLNPAEMGPVAVRIALEGTQARVDFSAALAGTRAAIEASLPSLAAALHDQGMTLAGGGVSDGQARPGARGEHPQQFLHRSGLTDTLATHDAEQGRIALPPRAARGLVDLVA